MQNEITPTPKRPVGGPRGPHSSLSPHFHRHAAPLTDAGGSSEPRTTFARGRASLWGRFPSKEAAQDQHHDQHPQQHSPESIVTEDELAMVTPVRTPADIGARSSAKRMPSPLRFPDGVVSTPRSGGCRGPARIPLEPISVYTQILTVTPPRAASSCMQEGTSIDEQGMGDLATPLVLERTPPPPQSLSQSQQQYRVQQHDGIPTQRKSFASAEDACSRTPNAGKDTMVNLIRTSPAKNGRHGDNVLVNGHFFASPEQLAGHSNSLLKRRHVQRILDAAFTNPDVLKVSPGRRGSSCASAAEQQGRGSSGSCALADISNQQRFTPKPPPRPQQLVRTS